MIPQHSRMHELYSQSFLESTREKQKRWYTPITHRITGKKRIPNKGSAFLYIGSHGIVENKIDEDFDVTLKTIPFNFRFNVAYRSNVEVGAPSACKLFANTYKTENDELSRYFVESHRNRTFDFNKMTMFNTIEEKTSFFAPATRLVDEYRKKRMLTLPQIFTNKTHDGIINKKYGRDISDNIITLTFTNGLRYNLLNYTEINELINIFKSKNTKMRHRLVSEQFSLDTKTILDFIDSLRVVTNLYIIDNSCSTYEVIYKKDFENDLNINERLDEIVEQKYSRYAKGGRKHKYSKKLKK